MEQRGFPSKTGFIVLWRHLFVQPVSLHYHSGTGHVRFSDTHCFTKCYHRFLSRLAFIASPVSRAHIELHFWKKSRCSCSRWLMDDGTSSDMACGASGIVFCNKTKIYSKKIIKSAKFFYFFLFDHFPCLYVGVLSRPIQFCMSEL